MPNKHPNVTEHLDTPLKFIGLFLLSGFLASLLGGIIEKVITYCIKDGEIQNGRIINSAYLLLQLSFNAIVFFVLLRTVKFSNKYGFITFDDWLSGTFGGIIFTATFFSSQTNLPIYVTNIFN